MDTSRGPEPKLEQINKQNEIKIKYEVPSSLSKSSAILSSEIAVVKAKNLELGWHVFLCRDIIGVNGLIKCKLSSH